jgi:hypothetical protein
MSQLDLLTELRAARPVAPPELRERVRLVAAQAAPPPRRRLTWRRAAIVLVPAVAGIVVAAVVIPNGEKKATPQPVPLPAVERQAAPATTVTLSPGTPFSVHGAGAVDKAAVTVPPSAQRVQRYSTYLELRVPTAGDVSDVTKRAVGIATSLHGYAQSVSVDARGDNGTADLVLRVPRAHVQEAVTRLGALGTIIGENVTVEDLTSQVNAVDRLIARLQTELRDLRAQPQTDAVKRKIDALTTRIQSLQRSRADTIRGAHYATIELQLTTHKPTHRAAHHGNGPLHGLGVAFRWIGIGAVYALALGTPLLAVLAVAWLGARAVRRRREDALLSSP